MTKTWLCLILALNSVLAFGAGQLELEPAKGYVYAEDRIPDFKAERKADESFILDPVPKDWLKLPLDGEWKILLKRTDGFVDYFNLDPNYGVDDMAQLLKPGYDFNAWKNVYVPLPLGQIKDNGYTYGAKKPGYIACYQRTIDVPDFKKGTGAAWLKFHGAGFRTDVWINGAYVGNSCNIFAPFEFDVTAFLQPGQKASILVKCIDSRYMLDYVDIFSSGITAPVELQIRTVPFAARIKLASDIAAGRVDGQFEMIGSVPAVKAQIVIEEAKSGKLAGAQTCEAKKGDTNRFSIKLDNPHCWSPEDPFLYVCKIKLDGKDAGITRFGFRTMAIKADADGRQHFYLNGKKLYLRIFEFNYYWRMMKDRDKNPIPENAWGPNYQGRLREALLTMKFANVNTLRPHSGHNDVDETLLNLCDELGFIVNFDWHGSEAQRVIPKTASDGMSSGTGGGQDYRVPMMEKNLPAFKAAMTAWHDHPSLCLISFGNELYDHLLSSGSYDGIIEKYKAALHEVDLQKRPTSGSAGRPTYRHNAKVDFVDDHQYIGVYYGSYMSVIPYIRNTQPAIKEKFGANLPFINSETGYVADDRIHPGNYRIFNPELSKDMFDKDLYIKTITGKTPELAWARLGLNSGGVRYYYTDLPEFKKRKGVLHVKRYLEMFRMNRKYNDGVSLNIDPASMASLADPDNWYGLATNPWPKPGKLTIIDPVFAFRQAFYPVQAFTDVANYHLFSGTSTKAPVMIVNDSLSNVVVDLVIQLRSPDGSGTPMLEKKEIAIPQGGDLNVPFEFTVPQNCPSGKSVLEMYILAGGKKIAENTYDIYTVAPGDRITQFPAIKLALYDTAGDTFAGFGAKTSEKVLKSLKIPFTQIKDFKDLAQYQVLVIGANSIDETLSKSGTEIAKWIADGGRLLMFEQCVTGSIPWSSGDRIYRMGDGSFVEHYFKKHPAFSGIENEMAWESPAGSNRQLFETCLELNDSFISVAAVSHYNDPGCPKAIITDRKMGKGEYMISMIKATDRFGKDATLTRYVENLLAYIMSGSISKYAVPGKDIGPGAAKVICLNKDDAFYVDISKAVNRGFKDDNSGSGWTGFGADADLRNIKPGMDGITGLVPFRIIDPAQNGGKSCIVLSGPKREQFPKASPEIPIGRKCKSLFFLHTAMYVKGAPGESILDYEITYSDGSKIIAPMRCKSEIGDWWAEKDYDNARVVYRDGDKCVFVSEWVNPTPGKVIASVKAVSKGNAIPIILAISANSNDRQSRSDRTELNDNRK